MAFHISEAMRITSIIDSLIAHHIEMALAHRDGDGMFQGERIRAEICDALEDALQGEKE